ncbi:MAG: PIN domain-containing protein [Variovorax sp.]|nr:PIN domain-containing protein [Variovorax sp.]
MTAVLDANVLYPTLVRDVPLSLAVADLYHARWSASIHEEWVRNLANNRPDISDRLPAIVEGMNSAVPDSLVTGYEPLVASLMLSDPDDRHVLAAAIVGHADAIVTFNLDDFPQPYLAQFNIEVQHPDRFVTHQLHLHKLKALTAIKQMRARWSRPARSAEELLQALHGRGLTLSADLLKEAIDLI